MTAETKTAPHPGKGRRKGRRTERGRQPSAQSLRDVAAILEGATPDRHLLLEYLHRIQDRHHGISAQHIAALAHHMRLSMAEIYEVASFYAHLDVHREDEEAPPPLTVRICDSLSCAMAGAEQLFADVAGMAGAEVRVLRAPCMGRCDIAPVAEVGRNHIGGASAHAVRAAIEAGDTAARAPVVTAAIDSAYAEFDACAGGQRTAAQVIDIVGAAGLRGLGGAGFPAARKWQFVLAEPKPRVLAVNADEGEPGTFKDRHYLETEPRRVLEGALIAAWAIEAEDIYFYLRDEYPHVHDTLRTEIAALEASGRALPRITLQRGAGAYICGEESAMLESIEGNRPLPRHRPPFPAQVGLFGRPTLAHNVETLYWIPHILANGADWFADQGTNECKGPRSYSVSGRVRAPGVKLAPAGITVRDLIDQYCGGMQDGHAFAAYLPGGASGGILPASLGNVPLDFGTLEPHGAFIGSAAVIILSDHDDMRGAALNLMRFFADESCGQCTPCRVGTEKAVTLMQDGPWDAALLRDLGQTMRDASICGLGQAAPNVFDTLMRYFPEAVR
ncbi:MAG: NAD(P)H-dependent oxidoreductase subunit E [Alphaproteobacteria bacterium]|nr:NAD(P)H-dependent oxidoreductase subunit E [Alphaproteobacteria bacterium]